MHPLAAPTRSTLKGLVLVLTSQCNLRCSYCYQNAKGPGRMSWETARGAIDTLLRSTRDELDLDLWGGEPLLEWPLMRRIVEYVRAHVPAGKRVSFAISTNGSLLDDEVLRFLCEHRVEVQVSFDGVPAAQRFRDPASFPAIDRALRRWRGRDPATFSELLSIAVTVHPRSLEALPGSVRYFHELGVPSVSLAPILTHADGWEVDHVDRLERCFEEVTETAVAHYRETGNIPLTMFQNAGTGARAARPDLPSSVTRALCRVMQGTKLVLDVTGDVCGCVVLAESYQQPRSSFLHERLAALRLGRIDAPDFDDRLAGYPDAADRAELFHRKEEKYSSYGKCGDCAYLDRCAICPVSIGHIPGNTDPRRVPDFPCAFNRVAAQYVARFDETVGPVRAVLGDVMRRKKQEFLRLVGRG